MLIDRLRTSAILVGISITLVVLDCVARVPGLDGVWMLPLMFFAAVGTSWEIATMLRSANHPIRRSIAVVGATVVSCSALVPFLWALSDEGYPADCPIGRLGWIILGSVAAIFGILIYEMWYFDRTLLSMQSEGGDAESQSKSMAGETIRRTSSSVFVSMYVGLPMAILVATRTMHAEETAGRFGLAAVITIITVTKVTDAGAYFCGRALGRHKLIPSLSPKKTIEGAIGGIVAATLAAFLCLQWLFPWFLTPVTADTTLSSPSAVKTGLTSFLASPIWGAVVLGPAVALSGMVGDLAESLFKRDSGVKDSGKLLPGLGGVWDVTDSLLAASVPAFFCFAAGVGGQ